MSANGNLDEDEIIKTASVASTSSECQILNSLLTNRSDTSIATTTTTTMSRNNNPKIKLLSSDYRCRGFEKSPVYKFFEPGEICGTVKVRGMQVNNYSYKCKICTQYNRVKNRVCSAHGISSNLIHHLKSIGHEAALSEVRFFQSKYRPRRLPSTSTNYGAEYDIQQGCSFGSFSSPSMTTELLEDEEEEATSSNENYNNNNNEIESSMISPSQHQEQEQQQQPPFSSSSLFTDDTNNVTAANDLNDEVYEFDAQSSAKFDLDLDDLVEG